MSSTKKTYVYRDGKMVLKSDEFMVEFVNQQYERAVGSVPNLTEEEYRTLYHTIGGAQTQEFIETHVYANLHKTDLPGGAYIPPIHEVSSFLELEPGTASASWFDKFYEKHPGIAPEFRKAARQNSKAYGGKGGIQCGAWSYQIARAKVCHPTVSSSRTLWPEDVPYVQESLGRLTAPRAKSVPKPPLTCKREGNTFFVNV